MADTQIIVRDYHVDRLTGHVTVRVQSHTEDGDVKWDGPMREYGVSAAALIDRFNGDISQYEAYVAQEHKVFMGVHDDMIGKLLQRKGAVIG